MVWCNQLVVALARLLRDIAQPSALPASPHNSKDKGFQQRIIHQMQAMTQPRIVQLLQWDVSSKWAATDASRETGQLNPAGKVCQTRQMSVDSMASEGQMLNIIQVSNSNDCPEG